MPRDNSWMVRRAMAIQPKTTEGTLYKRTSGDTFDGGTPYTMYIPPMTEASGIGGDGTPNLQGGIVLYQVGQTKAPDIDDKIIANNGAIFLVSSARPRLNFTDDYAVHDLQCVKVG